MTMIVQFPTKKALKEMAASEPALVHVQDPSFFDKPYGEYFRLDVMKVGSKIVVTNHPKRSWFAQIERTDKGFKVT